MRLSVVSPSREVYPRPRYASSSAVRVPGGLGSRVSLWKISRERARNNRRYRRRAAVIVAAGSRRAPSVRALTRVTGVECPGVRLPLKEGGVVRAVCGLSRDSLRPTTSLVPETTKQRLVAQLS